jgi:predicted small metal-binding protein
MSVRWRCLEPGCGTVVEAASDEQLLEAANAHMRDAHDSYELEEVILAGAEDPLTAGGEDSVTATQGSER